MQKSNARLVQSEKLEKWLKEYQTKMVWKSYQSYTGIRLQCNEKSKAFVTRDELFLRTQQRTA